LGVALNEFTYINTKINFHKS